MRFKQKLVNIVFNRYYRWRVEEIMGGTLSGDASARAHFSQCGEDRIAARILSDVETGTYVDVGANHPVNLSNTYSFYKRGWSGVCVEPHLVYRDMHRASRPRDVFLNLAVAPNEGELELHFGDDYALSSLSAAASHTHSVIVQTKPLSAILGEQGVKKDFELLSIDVEGLEVEVLETLDFMRYTPSVIIAEYNSEGRFNLNLQPYLLSVGYQIIAVTRYNVIATRDLSLGAKLFDVRNLG